MTAKRKSKKASPKPKSRKRKKKKSKASKKWKGTFNLLLLALLLAGVLYTPIPSKALVQKILLWHIPEVASVLQFDEAWVSVWKGVSLKKVTAKVPLGQGQILFKSSEVEIDISYIALLLGKLNIDDVDVSLANVSLPASFPSKLHLNKMKGWLTKSSDWEAFSETEFFIQTLKTKVFQKKWTINGFRLERDGAEAEIFLAKAKGFAEVARSLKAKLVFSKKKIKLDIQKLRFAKGRVWGQSRIDTRSWKHLSSFSWNSTRLQNVFSVFKPNKAKLKGICEGEFQFKGNLYSLTSSSGKGKLKARDVKISHWPIQSDENVVDNAPGFQKVSFHSLQAKSLRWQNKTLFWDKLKGEGSQMSFVAKGSLGWNRSFAASLEAAFPKSSWENFSGLGKLALTPDEDGKVRMTIAISGNMDHQTLDNYSEIASGAAWKKVSSFF